MELVPWLEGGLDTPEFVLGPREIEHNGRRALSVRAFLPDSRQAWLIDGSHGAAETSRPMRRIHPAGLFEAICPLADEFAHTALPDSGPR